MTPRRLLRRSWEILRAQGLRGLVFLMLADLGYRRGWLLARRLDAPVPPFAADVPLAFSRLESRDLDGYLRFHDEDDRAHLEARLAAGDVCFLARSEGRIVAASWAARGAHTIRVLRYRFAPRPGEAYLYDAYTDPALRGRGVAPALGAHVLESLRGEGITRVTLAVSPENRANLRARAKLGFRRCGRIRMLQIGSRRWHWHREDSS